VFTLTSACDGFHPVEKRLFFLLSFKNLKLKIHYNFTCSPVVLKKCDSFEDVMTQQKLQHLKFDKYSKIKEQVHIKMKKCKI
jgi:hypothetical protein